jgi:hypothetical protein
LDLFLDWDDIEDYSHLVQDDPEVLESIEARVHLASEFEHLRLAPFSQLEQFHNIMKRITTPDVEWDGLGVNPNTPGSSEPSGYSSYEEYEYEQWKKEQVGGGYTDETLPLDYSPMS